MNKNTKLIIYTAGAILGAFGVVILIRKGKESDEEVSDALDSESGKNIPEEKQISFEDKKKTLQSIIGFTGKDVDGVIGNITKSKLKELGLPSDVNEGNIDSIISKAKEVVASTSAKQVAEATNKARLSKANTLVSAFNKQGATKKATWIDNKATLKVYKKDVFGNFVAQNETITVDKNKTISFLKAEVSSNGFVRLNLATNMWLVVSPYSLTIF
jgi:hypothetical protein